MKKIDCKALKYSGDFIACAFVAAIFSMAAGLLVETRLGVIGGLVMWAVIDLARQFHVAWLEYRAISENSTVWDVEMNGVKVGTISDSDYAAIRLRAFRDLGNYLSQLLNLVTVVWNVARGFFTAMPGVVVWCIILAAIFMPEALTSYVAQLRTATPEQWTSSAIRIVQMMSLLYILNVGIKAALIGPRHGFGYGFVNQLDKDTRYHMGLAAEGDLVLLHRSDSKSDASELFETMQ